MSLWHAETRDKDREVSVTHIIAGPGSSASGSRDTFKLRFVSEGDDDTRRSLECSVSLTLGQSFFVPEEGAIRWVVVEPISGGEQGGEIKAKWTNRFGSSESSGWLVKRTPYDLKEFSGLWDLLVSYRERAPIDSSNLAEQLKEALLLPHAVNLSTGIREDLGTLGAIGPKIGYFYRWRYRVHQAERISDGTDFGGGDVSIAPVDRYFMDAPREHDPFAKFAGLIGIEELNKKLREWKASKFGLAGTGTCRNDKKSLEAGGDVLFPVKLRKERFDWTRAWIDRAVDHGHLSRELRPTISGKLRLPFAEAFSDLHREAEGLDSLELTALHDWLRGRLDREGQNIEVAGIGMPRHLLRSLGLFLILVVQVYAARHLSEAASRMEASENGDPGAFQPWILLYDGPWTRLASLVIIAAPTAVALVTFLPLVPVSIASVDAALSWMAFLGSISVAVHTVGSVKRLRAAARRHRMGPQQESDTASS